MENASGTTSAGDPYRRAFLQGGVLMTVQSIIKKLVFRRGSNESESQPRKKAAARSYFGLPCPESRLSV